MSEQDEGNGNEGSGKKLGPFAAAIAAIGMLIAKGGDDCARIGAKGASLSDDAARGLGRAGSLADDGMRAGARGPLPLPGPKPEVGGGLVEEAMSAGAKAESHADDLADLGVDVTLEVLSNVGPSDDGDDHGDEEGPAVLGGVHIPAPPRNTRKKSDPAEVLRGRTVLSSPALLSVSSASTKTASTENDPFAWIESHTTNNPIGLVFSSGSKIDAKTGIPLLLPNGETTDDAAIHRTCLGLAQHCVVLVCEPDSGGAKEPCAKGAATAWKSVEAMDLGAKSTLRDFLAKLLSARTARPSLRNLILSRLDVDATPPRIVRSRLDLTKTPKTR